MLTVVGKANSLLNICSFNLAGLFNGVLIKESKKLNESGIALHELKDNWYSYFRKLPKQSTIYFDDSMNAPSEFITSSEETIEVAKDLINLIVYQGGNSIALENDYHILGRSKLHKTEIILALYFLGVLNVDNIHKDIIYINEE